MNSVIFLDPIPNTLSNEQISSYFGKYNALVSIFTLKYKSHTEKRIAMIVTDSSISVNDLAYPNTPHRIEGIPIKLFVATKDEKFLHSISSTTISPPSSDTDTDSSTTDSSDEETIKPIPKLQPDFVNSSENDSSTTTSDSDDSSDSIVVAKQSGTNQQINNMSKSLQISSEDSTIDDSSDSSDSNTSKSQDSNDCNSKNDQPAKKFKTLPIVQTNTKNISHPKQQPAPFRRVDPGKVKVNNSFKSNKFFDKSESFGSYGQKAYEDFSNTRGKGFRQEKNKKKRGSYRGGSIDTGVHSIKFNDSD